VTGLRMAERVATVASPPADDAVLVAQAAGGDDRAFAALYRRYARMVATVIFRLIGHDGAELDDLVQQTFIDAALALDRLKDPRAFKHWALRIAVRNVYEHMARQRSRRRLASAVALIAPTSSDPAGRGRVDELYAALARLAPKDRIPWTLHHIEGATLPEVARMCDVSLATVKRRIARAEALMRGALR
jgi:RNA polymerase sigma-70 factor, ECF subfamily